MFGRWRALARSCLHHRLEEDSQSGPSIISHLLLRSTSVLADVLVVAGCKSNHSEAQEAVQNQFGERLTTVTRRAIQLNKQIGVNMTSADLLPMSIQPSDNFNPDWMDDTYGRHPAQDRGRADVVIGTTDLGLFRWEKSPSGQFDRILLLRPKVVLRSAVVEERER